MKILITGGTGGIGVELVKLLSKDKNNVLIVCARDEIKLKSVKKEVANDNVSIEVLDVADRNQVINIFEGINKLDVLINCAGVLGPVGKFIDNSLEDWETTLRINLLGTVNTCHSALPILLKSKRGKIINFSGGGAAYGRLGHSAYAASKTAVIRFTETLAMEYPSVDINSIAPGAHKTNIWKDETIEKEPDQWGNMEELKKFISFLVSNSSDGITGRFLHYKDDLNKLVLERSDNIFTLRRIDGTKYYEKTS